MEGARCSNRKRRNSQQCRHSPLSTAVCIQPHRLFLQHPIFLAIPVSFPAASFCAALPSPQSSLQSEGGGGRGLWVSLSLAFGAEGLFMEHGREGSSLPAARWTLPSVLALTLRYPAWLVTASAGSSLASPPSSGVGRARERECVCVCGARLGMLLPKPLA